MTNNKLPFLRCCSSSLTYSCWISKVCCKDAAVAWSKHAIFQSNLSDCCASGCEDGGPYFLFQYGWPHNISMLKRAGTNVSLFSSDPVSSALEPPSACAFSRPYSHAEPCRYHSNDLLVFLTASWLPPFFRLCFDPACIVEPRQISSVLCINSNELNIDLRSWCPISCFTNQ